MSHDEWCAKYRRMRGIAERISESRYARARKLCAAAGLDPGLLGIHPHNAMCSFEAGQPWKGVNYSLVRACIREMNRAYEGFRILESWDRRVRLSAN